MHAYLAYLRDLLDHGTRKKDRTGTGTLAVFGRQLRFDLAEGFPLVTTKRVHLKSVVHELLWFLQGGTNIRPLVQEGVHIWTDWPLARWAEDAGRDLPPVGTEGYREERGAFEQRIVEDEDFAARWGDLGPVYGKQWRDFGGVDQLAGLVEDLRQKPHSRRLLVSAWNPPAVPHQALPPCHYAFQCYVADGRLSLMWQQRSVDSFLGLPFNIASYALLTHMLAQQTDLKPGELIFSGGDCHLYLNHLDVAREQVERTPRPLPTLHLRPAPSLFDYTYDDVRVEGYEPHPALRAPVAV